MKYNVSSYRNIPILINFKYCTRFFIFVLTSILILISDANNYILRINTSIEAKG